MVAVTVNLQALLNRLHGRWNPISGFSKHLVNLRTAPAVLCSTEKRMAESSTVYSVGSNGALKPTTMEDLCRMDQPSSPVRLIVRSK